MQALELQGKGHCLGQRDTAGLDVRGAAQDGAQVHRALGNVGAQPLADQSSLSIFL